MRTVVLSIVAVAMLFTSCKNESNFKNNPNTSTETETSNELALADISIETTSEYLYVTAYSGLSLRAFNNLNSEKLAKMPYGTKVAVIHPEKNITMTIGGIKGGMDEVAFNHKKGYAFNGYLSKFFPPEYDISAKGYASELKEFFPKVVYTETTGGTASKPTTTETLLLPTEQWHEAFFVAQRLFDFPRVFEFPNPKGKNEEVIFDGKPKKGIWKSELQITRKDNNLEKIEYVYNAKKFSSTITIINVDGGMKIKKTELVK